MHDKRGEPYTTDEGETSPAQHKAIQSLVKKGLLHTEKETYVNEWSHATVTRHKMTLTPKGKEALEDIAAPLTDKQKWLLAELSRKQPVNMGKRPWSHIDTAPMVTMGLVKRPTYEDVELTPKGEAFVKHHNL